ncbi:MAG: hypothetical protein R3D05_07270 [Dongiaceae bacterium]
MPAWTYWPTRRERAPTVPSIGALIGGVGEVELGLLDDRLQAGDLGLGLGAGGHRHVDALVNGGQGGAVALQPRALLLQHGLGARCSRPGQR